MKYEDFLEKLMYTLNFESGENYEFLLRKATIRNEHDIDAILVDYGEDTKISPQLYVRDYYERYKHGMDIDELAAEIIEIVGRQREEVEEVKQAMKAVKAENAKERLIMHVMNKDWNSTMLDELIYLEIPGTDLIGVAKYDLPEIDGMISITKPLQEKLSMTEEEILSIAYNNTINKEYSLKGMFSVLEDLVDVEGLAEEGVSLDDGDDRMYVLSNNEKYFGASVLLSKEQLIKVEERIGDKLIVLPSSVHEVIVLKESEVSDDIENLKMMVEDVNATQVAPRDRLSANVYRVSGGKIAICNTQEQLQALQKEEVNRVQVEINKTSKRRTA